MDGPAHHPSDVRKNTDNVDEMKIHTVLGPALVATWLSGLHRLRRGGALRLRSRDIPALLDRRDVLVLDTETTGLGSTAEIVEVVAIDTTGALRLSALSLPVGPISQRSWEIHGLSEESLHAMGARPWVEVHPELLSMLRNCSTCARLARRLRRPCPHADRGASPPGAAAGELGRCASGLCQSAPWRTPQPRRRDAPRGPGVGGAPPSRRGRLPSGACPDARHRQRPDLRTGRRR